MAAEPQISSQNEVIDLAERASDEESARKLTHDYVVMVRIVTDALGARILLLLALLTSAALWGFAVYQPESLRLWATGLFTLGVFIPLVVLYIRKGGGS